MRSALGLTLMQMAGSRQVVLSGDPPAKAIYGAFPNQAGVLAALLAKQGLGADSDVIGGPAGLYSMIYGGQCDLNVLTGGLGTEFLLNDVEFKPWPTSNHVHSFIEAASNIPHLDASTIEAVEVLAPSELRPWCEPLQKRRRPDNPAAAANSIPFCVAKSLVHGSVKLKDFTQDGLRDRATLAVAESTSCSFDDQAKGAVVKVRAVGGQEHRATVETPLGHRSRPVSRERLVEKFRDCCGHAARPMTSEAIEKIVEMIDRLVDLDDVRRIANLAGGGR
jgi:2-methylcitrate dehydratase PrpD